MPQVSPSQPARARPTPNPGSTTLPRAAALRSDDRAWQALIDLLDCGIVVWDAEARLVICNDDFRRLYPPIADRIVPGLPFESLLRLAVGSGLLPQAAGGEDEFIAERLHNFGRADEAIERRMPDGRWRRIVERRLADGGVLSYSTDISELVEHRQALQQALADVRLAREQLEDAIEALPAGFELWDADDRLLMANTELARMYPHIASRLHPGVDFETLVRANHATGALKVPNDDLEAHIAKRRDDRLRTHVPAEHATDDGRWFRVYQRPTRHGALVGVRVDVSELHAQRAAAEGARRDAEAARRQLADAIEALPDGFALYDRDDRLVLCNERYRELYRASAAAIVPGTRFEEILRHGLAAGQYPQAQGQEEAWLAQRLQRHRHPDAPLVQQLPDNRWLRIDERITRDGGIAGVRTDVTELVRREQQLTELNAKLAEAHAHVEALSETDALTGIGNRRRFDRRLHEEWARVVRHGQTLALMLVDIDHFKRFNDCHGHPQGDACLQRVAQALAGCAGRATDVVARYGGEEFALLLPHIGRAEAEALAQRCVAVVDEARIVHGDSPVGACVTASVGLAWVGQGDRSDAAALLRAADEALYLAKAAGRHRAVVAG